MFSMAMFLEIVVGIASITSLTRANEINLDCYPNSTIIVTNPRPASLHYGLASDTDAQCNLTFSSDYTLITLTGCSKNDTIVIQLMETEGTSNVIGGTGNVLISIICKEIDQGLQRNITQSLGTNLVMDEISSVDPTFEGASYIRNNSVTDPPMTSIRLSESVFFTYDLYEGYVMRFLQCTAHPGRDTTTFDVSHKLIENDCTVDSSRIDSFAPSKITLVDKHTRYYTEMKMFRFWLSLYVTIVCDVRICRDDSSVPCTMATCDNTRRRRETVDVFKDVHHFTTTSTFKVLDAQDSFLFQFDTSSAVSFISGTILLRIVLCLIML